MSAQRAQLKHYASAVEDVFAKHGLPGRVTGGNLDRAVGVSFNFQMPSLNREWVLNDLAQALGVDASTVEVFVVVRAKV